MDFEFTAIPAISAVCFLIAEIVKTIGFPKKWVPVCCGISGLALGIVALNVMPGFPATDPLTSGAIGTVSGFAATGVHQVCKQLTMTGE